MARARNPYRDKAFELFKEHNGNITNREIANILNVPERTISVWKIRDSWNEKVNCSTSKKECSTSKKECSTTKKKRGGQPGNKNAVGHGAPKENKNTEKHGFFSKYLPEETMNIIQEIQEKDPLDILWDNIQIQYAAIIRAQRIMHVTSKDEMIKELKKKKGYQSETVASSEVEYEFQFAWDRQATFLQAQSRAMAELRNMIKQYDELLNANKELATEEQKLRIEKLKGEVDKLSESNQDKPIEILIKRKGED